MINFRLCRLGCSAGVSANKVLANSLIGSRMLSATSMDSTKLLTIHKCGDPSPMPPLEELKFGHFFADHFLEFDWDDKNGWNYPTIKPLQPIQLHPAASSLHYGLEVFEGLKAFKDASGKANLFRPMMNMERLRNSAIRMSLPDFSSKELLRLVGKLLKIDEGFIPQREGYSMYIRPCLFSTQPTVGVNPPNYAKLTVLLSPVGPYYPTGFKPIKVLAEDRYTRAFPGGVGDCKVGGNYGPTMMPQKEALAAGFNSVLWLFPMNRSGVDDYLITEAGTMNFFVYWINEDGELELATPSLARNLILPGVTRDSVVTLTRNWKEFKVSERDIFMNNDIIRAIEEGRVLEMFGTGTAAVVSPINEIGYKGKTYPIPLDPLKPSEGSGPIAKRLLDCIHDIQYGKVKHPWSVSIDDLI